VRSANPRKNQVPDFVRSSAGWLLRRVFSRVFTRKIRSREQFHARVEGKSGLEIGGPSDIFQDAGALPLYRHVEKLDNCVFSDETIWEGKRPEGHTFAYHKGKPNGFNFIREAIDLYGIPDRQYDFILSSHSLEHTANPVKAVKEWVRVLKPGATVIVLLPYYRQTFDHRRIPTPIEHMLEDYERRRDEGDLTHLDEILELHDLSRDRAAGSKGEFRERSLRNLENRCLHHHVFDETNSRELFEKIGLRVEVVEIAKPHHIVILATTDGSAS
jgi:SAM-dependent methyltransferase